ncbi:MAG: transporter [Methanobacteriota archaeon]|nr:MAG: transporter [Euryarchaeota archaeon]
MSPYALIFISVVLGAVGQIFLKTGMGELGAVNGVAEMLQPSELIRLFSNKFILLGFFNYGVASLLWLAVLSKVDVSKAYPFLSFGYVITALLATYYLKETVTPYRWLGIFLMIIGGYFLFKS